MVRAMPIRPLDSVVINQIAAGEVVERPAGVVRELIDNALDAGASRIDIDVDGGGIARISVRDDGAGIPADELHLALTRHATSKIACLEDLESLRSLGFRGEALPSIAAVADLSISSRTASAEHAWTVELGPGRSLSPPQPARGAQGTEVCMQGLFSKVPARRKFLRAERTEWSHLEGTAKRFALARPEVAFSLRHEGKLQWAREAEPLAQRIAALLGEDFGKAALQIEAEQGGLQLRGYASQPAWSRVQPDTQYFFLNGRYLRDRLIVGALRAAYAEVLHGSRQPGYVLFLDIPPDWVDVNVHPAKQEVRFRDSGSVFRFLRGALLEAIRADLPGGFAPSPDPLAETGSHPAQSPSASGFAPASAPPTSGLRGSWSPPAPSASGPQPRQPMTGWQVAESPAPFQHSLEAVDKPPLGFALGQLHQAYVLAQNEEGLVLVDMHAAHERIVLERLKQALGEDSCRAQPLLVPLEMSASTQELAALELGQPWLDRLGLDLRAIGPQTMGLFARPVLLQNYDLEKLVRDVLADLHVADGVDTHRVEAALDRALGNHACKAGSIKHGRVLSLPEMNALLRQIESTPRGGQCNHGRPTWRAIPLEELDGWFLRGR